MGVLMKFTVKSMVLAAMLVTGTANAAPIVNVDQASGSDVFLAVYDYTGKFSSIFDLGSAFSFSAVANGTATTQDFKLSTDASWISLVGATPTTNLQWGIFAGQKAGLNQSVLLETYKAGSTPVLGSIYKQNIVYAANTNLTAFLKTAETKGLTQGGSIYTSGTTNAPFAGTTALFGSTGKITAAGSVVVNNMDTFANVLTYTNTVNGPSASTLNVFDSQVGFKLSSAGVLSYTAAAAVVAVPESDTYAMLLAGLGVMGLVARRRLAA
jgi:hypothetical protein